MKFRWLILIVMLVVVSSITISLAIWHSRHNAAKVRAESNTTDAQTTEWNNSAITLSHPQPKGLTIENNTQPGGITGTDNTKLDTSAPIKPEPPASYGPITGHHFGIPEIHTPGQGDVGSKCTDVTSYDYDWDDDVLCTRPDGTKFYTNYAGGKTADSSFEE